MPTYFDEKTRTWYVKCYYVDYTGTKRQRKKRGFKLQREAKEWERNFLETQQADLTMPFENFISIYNEDIRHRIREHTYHQQEATAVLRKTSGVSDHTGSHKEMAK